MAVGGAALCNSGGSGAGDPSQPPDMDAYAADHTGGGKVQGEPRGRVSFPGGVFQGPHRVCPGAGAAFGKVVPVGGTGERFGPLALPAGVYKRRLLPFAVFGGEPALPAAGSVSGCAGNEPC